VCALASRLPCTHELGLPQPPAVNLQVNIIPKWVNFTVDVRCKREEFRQEVIALAEARVQALCSRRGLNCTVTRTHNAPPVSAHLRV
jgi:acetylornithine deacetylase/succinyl-diaminopimelate desuccinylase-like protein